jgi:hypothetical protein
MQPDVYGTDVRPDDRGIAIIREYRSGPRAEWEFDEYIACLPWAYTAGELDNPSWVLLKHGFRRPKGCEWEPTGYDDSVVATVVELPSNPLPLED